MYTLYTTLYYLHRGANSICHVDKFWFIHFFYLFFYLFKLLIKHTDTTALYTAYILASLLIFL